MKTLSPRYIAVARAEYCYVMFQTNSISTWVSLRKNLLVNQSIDEIAGSHAFLAGKLHLKDFKLIVGC